MSKYNKVSRSRSKERDIDEKLERFKKGYDNLEKEEEIKRKIERVMKDDNISKEKEWEKERQLYLQRENNLLWEIERLKNREQKYGQYNPERNRFPQTNYNPRGYQRFPQRQNQFYNLNRTSQYIDNPRFRYQNFERRNNNNNFNNNFNNNASTSYLNKIISNLDQDKNNNNYINDQPKYKNKIYLPQTKGVNLVGLLIGPKGIFQKKLEDRTGCKIYINGKNVKKKETFVNPYDQDRAHVLIIGYTEEKVRRATNLIENIIFADEKTRNDIIQEQLKAAKQTGEKNEIVKSDDYLMTPYGPPGPNARFYKVPNDLVGLIIGANGETIKKIAMESNCKVQAGISPIPNTNLRYIFIEGSEENYQIAVRMIEKIIADSANRQ